MPGGCCSPAGGPQGAPLLDSGPQLRAVRSALPTFLAVPGPKKDAVDSICLASHLGDKGLQPEVELADTSKEARVLFKASHLLLQMSGHKIQSLFSWLDA